MAEQTTHEKLIELAAQLQGVAAAAETDYRLAKLAADDLRRQLDAARARIAELEGQHPEPEVIDNLTVTPVGPRQVRLDWEGTDTALAAVQENTGRAFVVISHVAPGHVLTFPSRGDGSGLHFGLYLFPALYEFRADSPEDEKPRALAKASINPAMGYRIDGQAGGTLPDGPSDPPVQVDVLEGLQSPAKPQPPKTTRTAQAWPANNRFESGTRYELPADDYIDRQNVWLDNVRDVEVVAYGSTLPRLYGRGERVKIVADRIDAKGGEGVEVKGSDIDVVIDRISNTATGILIQGDLRRFRFSGAIGRAAIHGIYITGETVSDLIFDGFSIEQAVREHGVRIRDFPTRILFRKGIIGPTRGGAMSLWECSHLQVIEVITETEIGLGPLNFAAGDADIEGWSEYVYVHDCVLEGPRAEMILQAGLRHALIVNNKIDRGTANAVLVQEPNRAKGRRVEDVRFIGNYLNAQTSILIRGECDLTTDVPPGRIKGYDPRWVRPA